MELKIYQVDAFTDHLFSGNPAAVCPLDRWLPDSTMQKIAMENNLSETAFFIEEGDGFHIRWFTPSTEIQLCGHATLASAFVYFKYINTAAQQIVFHSHSGPLTVSTDGEQLTLDFPKQSVKPVSFPKLLSEALGTKPLEVFATDDWLVLVEDEAAVRNLQPDMTLLKQLDLRGVIVTSKGTDCDFVSRFFVPKSGVDEDPVTGSAHTKLTPFWAERLNKKTLHARQISTRGGEIRCELKGERVLLSGTAIPYLIGTITVESSLCE